MSSHFRLRRRDTRWMMFPVVVVFVGLSAIGIVVFSPDVATTGIDAVFAAHEDGRPAARQFANSIEEPAH